MVLVVLMVVLDGSGGCSRWLLVVLMVDLDKVAQFSQRFIS